MKNSQKIAISHFLIPLLFIVLIFTSFGISMDGNYAVELNESDGGVGSGLNDKDILENSQEDVVSANLEENDSLNAMNNNDVLGKTYSLNGGTFTDIYAVVKSANDGDVIKLSGTFYPSEENGKVFVNKRLTFTSDSMAVMNGRGISYMFSLGVDAGGSVFKNIKFINGNHGEVGGAMFVKAADVKITNCIFENNHGLKGGAIYGRYDATTSKNILIENCRFKGNTAEVSAGAVGVFANNSRIINCVFESNSAVNDVGNIPYGGAIQIGLDEYDVVGYVIGCTFINNKADSTVERAHGGAGCVRSGNIYRNCTFIGNSAGQGGALTYHSSGTIEDCIFINNTAFHYGGALSTGFLYEDMELNIINCNFENNNAPIGGAAQLIGENITFRDSTFNNNYASQTGGAVNVDAKRVIIENTHFTNNVANVDGGAVFINGASTSISNSEFRRNSAIPDVNKRDDGLGGAIYINSTQASIENNDFYFNTARNGSAIYNARSGERLVVRGNTMYQNQAWVYLLPIYANDIYYGETENIGSIIHGGNNIADYDNLAVSNAIYNAANNRNIEINGETPVLGATTSGELYQDDREYNMNILLTVSHEDGTVVYNKSLNSDCFGEVSDSLNNLKVGKYYVTARHFEDTYYKAISNTTTFTVTAKIDDKIKKSVSSDSVNYDDIVVWTINITNGGPSNATGVIVRDVLDKGLIWIGDDTNGRYNPKTGILTIGFIEVGQTYIFNIRTIVNRTGNIVNNVNVTANEYDYDLTNNHDRSDINVDPACDLAIIKTVNASSVNYGDFVKWTLTVVNRGPDVAHDVKVVDVLPRSLLFVRASGNYDSGSGVWNVGTLNSGASVSLDIICKPSATGIIENEATVSGREYDWNESNNHDSEVILVNKSSDLSISKSVNASTVNYGDFVKWTLSVVNNGPDDATGVKIVDVLPRGFVYVSSTRPFSNNVINIGNLAAGARASVDIVTKVAITGSFVNVASVSGNEYDWDLTNNRDDESILVNPATDLSVIKEVNQSRPNYGDLITWTIIVSNNGPDTAHQVQVQDLLPKSLIFVRSSESYNSATGVWNVGTLNKGASISLDIICKVNATGAIKNAASVSGREYDGDLTNNRDDETINVAAATDLAIDKKVNASTVNYKDLVKWTLTVVNNGPDAATGVKIVDVLPRGFVYVSSTRPYSNNVISIGNLAAGARASVDIVTMVNITGSFVNVASVSGNEYDWNLANNRDDESILVNPATDLSVLKQVNNSSPNFGELVKWTLTVSNNGPDTAHEVVVQDSLPKSLIWISDDSSGKYNHNSGLWGIGTLNKGAKAVLNIISKVNATGAFTNEASVSGREYDWDKSNNKDDETIIVPKASDLSVSKLANVSAVNYNQLVKWTVVAYNNGPDNATGVVVEEILPDGLQLVSHKSTKGTFRNGIWSVDGIEKGATQTLELICKVTKTGNIQNVVSISGNEYDPDLSNNEDEESILVFPSSDIAVFKDVNNTDPYYGDMIEWHITVTNNGPDKSSEVTVLDSLPAGLRYVGYEATKGVYQDEIWYIDDFDVGDSETLTIRCIVETLDDVTNVVRADTSEYDWNKSNNDDSKIISPHPVADVSIAKLINVSEANYLDLVKWTLVVTNNGPNDATGVHVTDIMPKGLEIVKILGDGELEDSIWDIGSLKNGQSKYLEIVCKIKATGEFANSADVDANEYDPVLENNEDENYLYVGPASDLSITKTVSKYRYSVGDVVRYSINLLNKGPDEAVNVRVNEIMDDSLLLKSFMASAGDFDEEENVWSLDTLGVGESASLDIDAVATESGTAENSVYATNDNYDPDLTNNEDDVIINVTDDFEPSDKVEKQSPNNPSAKSSFSILEKNRSGNPFIGIMFSIVSLLVLFCGSNISKKR